SDPCASNGWTSPGAMKVRYVLPVVASAAVVLPEAFVPVMRMRRLKTGPPVSLRTRPTIRSPPSLVRTVWITLTWPATGPGPAIGASYGGTCPGFNTTPPLGAGVPPPVGAAAPPAAGGAGWAGAGAAGAGAAGAG